MVTPQPNTKVTPEQWAAVDWSRTSASIARELGVSNARVGQKREKLAPHTIKRRARAAPAVAPARAPDHELRKRDLLARIDDLERRLGVATRAFTTARAALETAVSERDELQRRLNAVALEDPHANEAGTIAAERDIALAELQRLKSTRKLRPELLHALHRATTQHPELPDFITGTAPTDSWFPHENPPGTTRHKGRT